MQFADYWEVVESYLPNYHSRDDVLYLDICSRYVNGEDLDESDKKMIEADFKDETEIWDFISKEEQKLFDESMKAMYDELKPKKS